MQPNLTSGTATLLRLISLTAKDSDGRCVRVSEPFITRTIYKTLQLKPISFQYKNQQYKTNNNVIQHSTYKQAKTSPEINQNKETRKL